MNQEQIDAWESQRRILAELNQLDIKRIRPLAEGDAAYLAELNVRAVALRDELKQLLP